MVNSRKIVPRTIIPSAATPLMLPAASLLFVWLSSVLVNATCAVASRLASDTARLSRVLILGSGSGGMYSSGGRGLQVSGMKDFS